MIKKLLAVTMVITMLAATPAYAGQWMQDSYGWWWQNDDGSYIKNWSEWLDGNNDGIYELYYFDENGYLMLGPELFGGMVHVNENGAWMDNGVVQTSDYKPKDFNADEQRKAAEERAAKSTQENALEDVDPYELAYRIVELVNEEREARGRGALDINDELMQNAMLRAEEANGHFSHTRPDGNNFDTAITIEFSLAGENIAGRGYLNANTVDDFARKAVDGWMNSSGHKKNLLDSRWEVTGVGVYITDYGYTVSQLFIK